MEATLSVNPVIDHFSVDLYSAATELQDGNFMISPVGILYASLLLYLGSHGSTQSNIYTSLRLNQSFPDDKDKVFDKFGQLMDSFKSSTDGHSNSSFKLMLSNGIFLENRLDVLKTYTDTAQGKLKASVMKEDFAGNPDSANDHINKWVEQRTNGKIKTLFAPGVIKSDTLAVLANTVFFKAGWANRFDQTESGTFTLKDGSDVQTEFMKTIYPKCKYNEYDSGVYLEIPYLGDEASLLIFMASTSSGFTDMEKNLTAASIRQMATDARFFRSLHLTMPKFLFETSLDLVKLLKKLGMDKPFSAPAADFSQMSSEELYVSDGVHKTYLRIDENGTEASAASGFRMVSRTGPKFVSVNRPFVFAIRHNPTDSLLFIGRIEKPVWKD